MSDQEERIKNLIQKYVNDSCSKEERDEFFDAIRDTKSNDALHEFMEESWSGLEHNETNPNVDWNRMYENILGSNEHKVVKITQQKKWWYAAAAVIAGLGIVSVLLLNNNKSNELAKTEQPSKQYERSGTTGFSKAMLTLADGRQVKLDTAPRGTISDQGPARVVKLAAGQLSYQRTGGPAAGNLPESRYNTLTTPVGGQYQVMLSDGSQVWMNASSTLRYPVSLEEGQRTIELTGEAYFEVKPAYDMATGKKLPFSVMANGTEVQVLGTHFNVMAYNNEPVTRTTLLEGSVRVARNNEFGLLKPGQEAVVQESGAIKVQQANSKEAIAWKNGYFEFNNADLQTVLKQAERWYDVKFDYNGTIKAGFTGEISRKVSIVQFIQILESTKKVHFDIREKSIKVSSAVP